MRALFKDTVKAEENAARFFASFYISWNYPANNIENMLNSARELLVTSSRLEHVNHAIEEVAHEAIEFIETQSVTYPNWLKQ